ncbi:MAG: hypothetical protein O3C63_02355 [Cyanobacteria bacterium]|nr:hypothetical protein [Cyanobacteriota bacterium]MDA1020415.1 hypothetical protein [Cyanobacteriota bacterium]
MALNEKEKTRFLAILKAMKEQKGYVVKQSELQADIKHYKKSQAEIEDLKKEYSDCPAVLKEADAQKKKLQNIINDLNQYMQILHPEGLLDMGSSGFAVGKG